MARTLRCDRNALIADGDVAIITDECFQDRMAYNIESKSFIKFIHDFEDNHEIDFLVT
jgi:hypothetical protein